jgi:hypothetical protein
MKINKTVMKINIKRFRRHFHMEDKSSVRLEPTSHLSCFLPATMTKDTKPHNKWTNRCKAHKILRDGLTSGDIDPSQKPKEVWESNTEFQKYALASFRAAFNREKASRGTHVRDEGKLSLSSPCFLFIFDPFHPFYLFIFVSIVRFSYRGQIRGRRRRRR